MNWYRLHKALVAQYANPPTWGYWLDTRGQLLPVPAQGGHKDILAMIGVKHYREAFAKGYVRLVTENKELYVNNDGGRLTPAQIQTLLRMSNDYNFVSFVTDGDKSLGEDHASFQDPLSFKNHLRSLQVQSPAGPEQQTGSQLPSSG